MNKLIIVSLLLFLIISKNLFAETSWITKKNDNKINKDESCTKNLSVKKLNIKSDYFIDIEDYDNAFKCSIYAANKKDTYAEGSVGWFYKNGFGVDRNYDKAIEYIDRARKKGNDYARNLLADMYENKSLHKICK